MSLDFDMSQLKKKLASLEKKVANKVTRDSLNAGADEMLKTQKAQAPKDTGKLRDSLEKSKVKTKKGTMNASEEVQRYGYYQHYGSRGKLGTFWMDEAYQKGIDNSLDAIKETIAKGLKE